MSKLTPLGLSEDAAPEEVEARYAELTAFLRSKAVPTGLRSWAEQQLALLDDYYATGALEEWEPPRAARGRANGARQQRPPQGRPVAPRRKDAQRAAQWTLSLPQSWAGLSLVGLVAGLVVAALIVGFLSVRGDNGGSPDGGVPAAGQVALDEARVAELKAVIAQQPDNQDALFELGELYFEAGQWEPAIEWFTKLVALDAANLHALTDIGTAYFNLARPQDAKTYWEKVVQVDPNDVQAHYNLGFYYANVDPRDLGSAVREWETVISLDPNSPQAQTARVHIEGLKAEATPQAPAAGTP